MASDDMIMHSVSDETLWTESARIDRTLVYGHQTRHLDNYNFADDIQNRNGGKWC
jgi:hypothetical protein